MKLTQSFKIILTFIKSLKNIPSKQWKNIQNEMPKKKLVKTSQINKNNTYKAQKIHTIKTLLCTKT